MTTPTYITRQIFPAAAALLPAVMDVPDAWSLLFAIGRQESRYLHRRQLPNGPARGFWQFELGGVEGVLEHHASNGPAASVMTTLGYPLASARDIHLAIEHNDVLAACFARLLLWTDPRALPNGSNPTQGWLIYLATWRPGKPRPDHWASNFSVAWDATQET